MRTARGADGRPRPSRTISNTSSSRVAAVTSGPAPGPTKHWGPPTASSRIPFVAPLIARQRMAPGEKRRPDERVQIDPVDQVACASGFSVPPSARAARRSAGINRIDTPGVDVVNRHEHVRELTKQQRELFRGVPPVTSADGSGSAKPTPLRVGKRHLEGGSRSRPPRIAFDVPLRTAVRPRTRDASGRRSNVPRNGTPAMQLAS